MYLKWLSTPSSISGTKKKEKRKPPYSKLPTVLKMIIGIQNNNFLNSLKEKHKGLVSTYKKIHQYPSKMKVKQVFLNPQLHVKRNLPKYIQIYQLY